MSKKSLTKADFRREKNKKDMSDNGTKELVGEKEKFLIRPLIPIPPIEKDDTQITLDFFPVSRRNLSRFPSQVIFSHELVVGGVPGRMRSSSRNGIILKSEIEDAPLDLAETYVRNLNTVKIKPTDVDTK